MRTPPPGGTLIRLLESTLPLLKCNNIDRLLRIVEKSKRQKGQQQSRHPQESLSPTQ